jgi:hypothetical protein
MKVYPDGIALYAQSLGNPPKPSAVVTQFPPFERSAKFYAFLAVNSPAACAAGPEADICLRGAQLPDTKGMKQDRRPFVRFHFRTLGVEMETSGNGTVFQRPKIAVLLENVHENGRERTADDENEGLCLGALRLH